MKITFIDEHSVELGAWRDSKFIPDIDSSVVLDGKEYSVLYGATFTSQDSCTIILRLLD